MNIFMCWSGERSREVAAVLRDWLRLVIQSAEPWLSVEDIHKGARWMTELNSQLAKTKMGIICLTPENRQAPWLLFEAGVLSNVVASSLVCPFLIGLKQTDVEDPLAQFQATLPIVEDVMRLLTTINEISDKPLDQAVLERTFSAFWPELQEKLKAVEAAKVDQPVRQRSESELLTEVLERVRSVERRVAEVIDVREAWENQFPSSPPMAPLSLHEIETLLRLRRQEIDESPSLLAGTVADRAGTSPYRAGRYRAGRVLEKADYLAETSDHPPEDHEPEDHEPDYHEPPNPQP